MFVVHFWADVLAAVPLFVAPQQVLGLLGWASVDPLATRIVAAALFGIGIESYLGRNAARASFREMLNLKVIWSASATVGSLWSVLEGGPAAGWAVVAIFGAFHLIWLRYRLLLGSGVQA
jgi:hypothetical protein